VKASSVEDIHCDSLYMWAVVSADVAAIEVAAEEALGTEEEPGHIAVVAVVAASDDIPLPSNPWRLVLYDRAQYQRCSDWSGVADEQVAVEPTSSSAGRKLVTGLVHVDLDFDR